jgi:hypothetical protein
MAQLPGVLGALLFCGFFIAAGILMSFGTYKRWAWLVDPPREYRFVYSQSAIRALFGERGVIIWTYVMGAVFVAVGVFGLCQVSRALI